MQIHQGVKIVLTRFEGDMVNLLGEVHLNITYTFLLPVGGTMTMSEFCHVAWTLVKHVEFEIDLTMYTQATTASCLMAAHLNMRATTATLLDEHSQSSQ